MFCRTQQVRASSSVLQKLGPRHTRRRRRGPAFQSWGLEAIAYPLQVCGTLPAAEPRARWDWQLAYGNHPRPNDRTRPSRRVGGGTGQKRPGVVTLDLGALDPVAIQQTETSVPLGTLWLAAPLTGGSAPPGSRCPRTLRDLSNRYVRMGSTIRSEPVDGRPMRVLGVPVCRATPTTSGRSLMQRRKPRHSMVEEAVPPDTRPKTFPKGRRCRVCKSQLTVYNPGPDCYAHGQPEVVRPLRTGMVREEELEAMRELMEAA